MKKDPMAEEKKEQKKVSRKPSSGEHGTGGERGKGKAYPK
jgi:hypothetical protein